VADVDLQPDQRAAQADVEFAADGVLDGDREIPGKVWPIKQPPEGFEPSGGLL